MRLSGLNVQTSMVEQLSSVKGEEGKANTASYFYEEHFGLPPCHINKLI